MRAPRHRILPDDDLQPTKPLPNISVEDQVRKMRELRTAQNKAALGYRERDDLMVAWALSNTLSREDMARACGLALSRVNQIIRTTYERDQDKKSQALRARAARHTTVDSS